MQSELTNFMNQISPPYKRKVTKDNFKNLVKNNSVLKQIKDDYMEAKLKYIRKSFRQARHREMELKEEERCIT